MRILRFLSAVTAFFAYVLVALSPVVRITNSGLGCGDHWPLCNGHVFPPLDNPAVMIEWGHRLAVVGLTSLMGALALVAWVLRGRPGVSGPGGVLRPAAIGLALLVVQSLLGAVTVWLELPAGVVVVHLLNAMALLAAVLVAALRAFTPPGTGAAAPRDRVARGALAAAGLAAVTLAMGALTANLDAGLVCQGFPLCNGRWWPAAGTGGLAHLHWTHRLLAYALTLHVAGLVVVVWRRRSVPGLRAAVTLAGVVLGMHVFIAARMILELLPLELRITHAALGALVWSALVLVCWVAIERPRRAVAVA